MCFCGLGTLPRCPACMLWSEPCRLPRFMPACASCSRAQPHRRCSPKARSRFLHSFRPCSASSSCSLAAAGMPSSPLRAHSSIPAPARLPSSWEPVWGCIASFRPFHRRMFVSGNWSSGSPQVPWCYARCSCLWDGAGRHWWQGCAVWWPPAGVVCHSVCAARWCFACWRRSCSCMLSSVGQPMDVCCFSPFHRRQWRRARSSAAA